MKVFVVNDLWKSLNFLPDSTLKAIIRSKVEGGYIIEINGERIFAKSELSIPPGAAVTLKPVSFSEGKAVFKVQGKQEGHESLPSPKASMPEALPYMALSNLNLPITKERVRMLSRIIKRILVRQKEGSDPEPALELGIKILNAAHLSLKDKKVVFLALHHPVYGEIPVKVKENIKSKTPEEPSTSISFAVRTRSLGRIIVNLLYSKGKMSGALVFESPEKLNRARSLYEEVQSELDPSPFIESLQWRWKSSAVEDFFTEDLEPFQLNRNLDILL